MSDSRSYCECWERPWGVKRHRPCRRLDQVLYHEAQLYHSSYRGLREYVSVVFDLFPLLTVPHHSADFENQGAYRLAKLHDPDGKRTIGTFWASRAILHLLTLFFRCLDQARQNSNW